MLSGRNISTIELQIAEHVKSCKLPDDVRFILEKWFTANHPQRPTREAMITDFERKEIVQFTKLSEENKNAVMILRSLCEGLEQAKQQISLKVEVVYNSHNHHDSKKKPHKVKKQERSDGVPNNVRKAKKQDSFAGASKMPAREATDIDALLDAGKKSQERKALNQVMIKQLDDLRLMINGLLEKNKIAKDHSLKVTFNQIQSNIRDSSSNFPYADYQNDIQGLQDSLNALEKRVKDEIARRYNHLEQCATLGEIADIKKEADKYYQSYIAHENVVSGCEGLSYLNVFDVLHQKVLVLQKELQPSIKSKYTEIEALQPYAIQLITDFFNVEIANQINLDAPEHSSLLEHYDYLKRLVKLRKLESELIKANTEAKQQIIETQALFEKLFFDKKQQSLLAAFYKQSHQPDVISQFTHSYQELTDAYHKGESQHPYKALQYSKQFVGVQHKLEGYDRTFKSDDYQAFLLNVETAKKPGALRHMHAAKEMLQSFYRKHPYVSWALIGAGVGLGIAVVAAVVLGLTVLTGCAFGVVVGTFFATLFAVKVGGGAAAAATAGASVAVTSHAIQQRCSSTANLKKRLEKGKIISIDDLASLPDVPKSSGVTPLRPVKTVVLRDVIGASSASGLRLPRGLVH